MNKKFFFFGIAVAVIVGGGGWALKSFVLPQPVMVATALTSTAVEAVYATGTVEPSVMIPLSPKATGRLTAINADEGARVQKGAVLARFEDQDVAALVQQLTAQVTLAEKEFMRKEKLFSKKYVSVDAFDQARANLDVARAALKEALAKSDFLTLLAPADATIIRRDGEVGEVISAGTPVFYLSCCSPLRISAEVDEEDIVHVKNGMDVLIQSDAFPDQMFHGTVAAVTPKGDPVARSYRVRISFDEDTPLMIGMTAETNIIYNRADQAILVPVEAVNVKNNRVQRVISGVVEEVPVEVGIRGVRQIQIVKGVAAGEEIVVPFDPNLEAGRAVSAKKDDTL